MGDAGELVGAWVGGLEAAKVGFKVVAAVGVEELGGEVEAGEGVGGGGRCDFGDGVAGCLEGGDGGGEGALDGGGRRDDA
jgi:hypothetical protein